MKTQNESFESAGSAGSAGSASDLTQKSACLAQKEILSPKEARQQAFLQAYKANDYNISAACRALNICRRTYYKWVENDPDFLLNLKSAQDEKHEAVESALYQKALEGNVIAQIFYLKAKCNWCDQPDKHRIEISHQEEYDKHRIDAVVRAAEASRQTDRQFAIPHCTSV